MILLALRPRHDGQGLVARYWNALGVYRRVTLEIAKGVTRVWRCDLMERPVEEQPIQLVSDRDETKNWVFLEVAPYGIDTLLIEFE